MIDNVPGDGGEGAGDPAAVTPNTYTIDSFKEAGIPDSYVKDGAVDLKSIAASITEAQTLKTAAEDRAKGVPQDGKYDFAALPKDFKAPDGIDLKSWKVNEAWAAEVAPALKELGLSQSDVTKLVGAVARADAAKKSAQATADQAREAAELKSLGDGGPTRLQNLEKAITAAGYGALLDDKSTLAQRLEAFEKIINSGPKMAAHANGGNGKERPDANKLTGAQMHRMAIQETARQ